LEIDKLLINDFTFDYVDKSDFSQCKEIIEFIERYEWLGKMPIWITHRFVAREKSTKIISCVVIMATPNSFSNVLGEENKNKEKLIARGASISWSPKNLGSWMIMKSIKWMVENTEFRFFSAYSDPEAKELGTIYQACNFYYLGQTFGNKHQYLDPENEERGWFGDTGFSYRSSIIRYAKKLGIEWKEEWYGGKGKYKRKVKWSAIPDDIKESIKKERDRYRDSCIKRPTKPKHKYIYILGKNKRETKELRNLFKELNSIKPYPKIRSV
jgi:hypothetical protein